MQRLADGQQIGLGIAASLYDERFGAFAVAFQVTTDDDVVPGLDFNVQESIADVDSLMGSTQHQSVQFPFFVHRPGS